MASKNNSRRMSPRLARTQQAVEKTLSHSGFGMCHNSNDPQIIGFDMKFRKTEEGFEVDCHDLILSMVSWDDKRERIYDDSALTITVYLRRGRPNASFTDYSITKTKMQCTCLSCGGAGGNDYHWPEYGGVCAECDNTGYTFYTLTDEQGAFSDNIPCPDCAGDGKDPEHSDWDFWCRTCGGDKYIIPSMQKSAEAAA